MSITAKQNTSITRTLTTESEGREKPVATLTGQVSPGRAMTLSLVVSDAALAAANAADVSGALDDFTAELRQLAAENGLPV